MELTYSPQANTKRKHVNSADDMSIVNTQGFVIVHNANYKEIPKSLQSHLETCILWTKCKVLWSNAFEHNPDLGAPL